MLRSRQCRLGKSTRHSLGQNPGQMIAKLRQKAIFLKYNAYYLFINYILLLNQKTQGQTMRIDRHDRHILEILQTEGRISNQELADRVGLSPSPCLRRVRALEEVISTDRRDDVANALPTMPERILQLLNRTPQSDIPHNKDNERLLRGIIITSRPFKERATAVVHVEACFHPFGDQRLVT